MSKPVPVSTVAQGQDKGQKVETLFDSFEWEGLYVEIYTCLYPWLSDIPSYKFVVADNADGGVGTMAVGILYVTSHVARRAAKAVISGGEMPALNRRYTKNKRR